MRPYAVRRVHLGDLAVRVDHRAVLAADHHRFVGRDRLAVHTRAVVRRGDLLAVAVQHPDPRTSVLGALGDHQRVVRQLDGHAVVGRRRRVLAGRRVGVGHVLRVEHAHLARAVVEQRGAALVDHYVARLDRVVGDVGECGLRRPVVRVVPVGLGPRTQVESLERAGGRDQQVALVTGRVEPVEALQLDVADGLETHRVQHLHATVVGDGDARRAGLDLGGVGRLVLVGPGGGGLRGRAGSGPAVGRAGTQQEQGQRGAEAGGRASGVVLHRWSGGLVEAARSFLLE